MQCDEIRDQLLDYLAGQAEPPARVRVEAHLAGCAECRQEAEMWARMENWQDEQPSPQLAARVGAMLNAYRAGHEQAEQKPKRRITFSGWLESWWPYRPVPQFAIAAACLVVGVLVGHQWAGRGASSQELARLQEEVRNTRQLVALSLMQQQSAAERLRGVSYGARAAQSDSEVLEALIRTVKYDANVDVRLAAVDALRRYSAEPAVRQGILQALEVRQSPLMQVALIDFAVDARLRQAAPILERLKADQEQNPAVRQRAEWGLQRF